MTSTQNLFQFWNTKEIPDEIKPLMATWAALPEFDHRVYDADTAAAYIATHIGEVARNAYLQCAVPAMQADFFRYCALYHEGGAYVDSGTHAGGDLAKHISEAERGMLMKRDTKIPNGFMYFKKAKDPLLKQVIEQGIANINSQLSNNVWQVTGPGIMTNMYQDIEKKPAFDGITFTDISVIREIVRFRHDLEYRSEDTDWRYYLTPGSPSIFKPL